MKVVVLLHLEEDQEAVAGLLREHQVIAWSGFSLEGHGVGAQGWYGSVAPYRSRMSFTVVPAERADDLLAAVAGMSGLADPRHPVHALQLDIEKSANSGDAT